MRATTRIPPITIFITLVGFVALAGVTAGTESGSDPVVMVKEAVDHGQFQCLTGLMTAEEALVRDELERSRYPKTAGSNRAARMEDVGNIVVMEDDGTLIVPANPFTLDHRSMVFVPNGLGSYDVLGEPFGYDTALGAKLNLSEDSAERVNFPAGFSFPFFGRAQTSVFVSSNGNLTFGAANIQPGETASGLFSRVQISAFWDDLDPSAGDGVYVRQTADRLVVTWSGVPEFQLRNSNTFQATLFTDGRIRLTYVEISALDGVVGISPGSTVAASNVLFRDLPVRGRRGALLEVFSAFPALNTVRIAQRFYEGHSDHFDVLTTWTNFDMGGAGGAFYQFIKNEVQGIGRLNFDYSARYGSGGRLRGLVFMNNINSWPSDPWSRLVGGLDNNSTISVLAQELGHRWLADVRFNDNGVISNELLGRQFAHWSYFANTESSQSSPQAPLASSMEGNAWRDNRDGTFTSAGVTDGYSHVDQYIMGLRRPDEVSDFFVVTDRSPVVEVRGSGPDLNVTVRGSKRNVSVGQVVQAEGPRLPAFSDSPKVFRTAFVLVVPAGRSAAATELAKLDLIRTEWEKYFSRHTDGRGAYDTGLKRERMITSIDPPRGIPGSTFDAVIRGIGFAGATEVSLGEGVTATLRAGASDVALPVRISIAAGAAHGSRRIVIQAPGGLLDSDALNFQVTSYTALAGGLVGARGIAVSKTGDVYAAITSAGTIVKIGPDGAAVTLARGLVGPVGLAFNSAGELFVSESAGRISRVSAAGVVAPFVAAGLPTYLAFDSRDNLYFLNSLNSTVSRVSPSGAVSLFTLVPGLAAGGIAVDATDNVYISNYSDQSITRVTPEGRNSLFASLAVIEGLAFDRRGNLFAFAPYYGVVRIGPTGSVAVISDPMVLGSAVALATSEDGGLYALSGARGDLLRFPPSVLASPAGSPWVDQVFPPAVAPGRSGDAVIFGSGLSGATAVSFSGRGVTAVIRPGGTSAALPVRITVAADAPTGARQVVVTTPQGTGTGGTTYNFLYSDYYNVAFAVRDFPEILSVAPSNPAAGQNVVITGRGFEDLFSETVTVLFQQGTTKAFLAAIWDRRRDRIVARVPTVFQPGTALLAILRDPEAEISDPVFINIGTRPAAPEIGDVTPRAPSGGQRILVTVAGLPFNGTVNFTLNGNLKLEAKLFTQAARNPERAKSGGPDAADASARSEAEAGLLDHAMKDKALPPRVRDYLLRALTTDEFEEDADVSTPPALVSQTIALIDLPPGLRPGPATLTANVVIGGVSSNESKAFQFLVPDAPAPLRIEAAFPNVRSVGQVLAAVATQGAGFAARAEDNVAIFSQGDKSFASAGVGFRSDGLAVAFPVPEGLRPGAAEMRVSASLSPRAAPAGNPVGILIDPVPSPPAIVSLAPPAAGPGSVVTIKGALGSFSPNPQDNKITFSQTGPNGSRVSVAPEALTADALGSEVTVRLPEDLQPGAVDVSASTTIRLRGSSPSAARRMAVTGTLAFNVPLVPHGFLSAAGDVLETAVSLTNVSGREATVFFQLVSPSGALLHTVASPVSRTLKPGERQVVTVGDLLLINTSTAPLSAWMRIRSDAEVQGSYFVLDPNNRRFLDGAPLTGATSRDLVFPHAELDQRVAHFWTTTLYSVVNPGEQPADVTVTEFNGAGEAVGPRPSRVFQIPAGGSILLTASAPDRVGGHLRVKSDVPVAGAMLTSGPRHLSLMNAQSTFKSSRFTLGPFASTLSSGTGFETRISVVNAADTTNEVLLSAFDEQQRLLGSVRQILDPNQQMLRSVSSLFAGAVTAESGRGYVVGRASAPGASASAEISFIRGGSKEASSALDAAAAGTRLIFPEAVSGAVAGSGGEFLSGLTLVNPLGLEGSTLPPAANIRLTLYDGNGAQKATATLILEAGRQVSRFLLGTDPGTGFFQSPGPLASGYVVATSDIPIAGSVTIFTTDLSQMAVIPGRVF